MKNNEAILNAYDCWYASLKGKKRYNNLPPRGLVGAALVVLEHLREDCDLELNTHLAKGGAQIAGLTPSKLKQILKRYGESRNLSSEAGRTNRGNPQAIASLLDALKSSGLHKLPAKARSKVVDEMQLRLARTIDAYFQLKPLQFDYESGKLGRTIVGDILSAAQERQQAGVVAQHLVGAKLSLRFPELTIDNYSSSAADEQPGRQGDFRIGDTVFHVTVAPTAALGEKCLANARAGLSVIVLVPEQQLAKMRDLLSADNNPAQVFAESLETFIGQNMGEMSEFRHDAARKKWAELLAVYNQRAEEAENDASLLISIPASLL